MEPEESPPWPPSAAQPPAAPAQREAFLRERLLARARAAGRGEASNHRRVVLEEGPWQVAAPGVRIKLLNESPVLRSWLMELAPGATFTPSITQPTDDECVVLRGELRVGGLLLREGDYLHMPSGMGAGEWASTTGARFFLHSHGLQG